MHRGVLLNLEHATSILCTLFLQVSEGNVILKVLAISALELERDVQFFKKSPRDFLGDIHLF